MNSSDRKYCFFISGSWGENANRDRLESLAQALTSLGHKVVIILDHNQSELVDTTQNPSIFTWPSYRPTKLKDALFLYKLTKLHKPDCMLSQFGSVNVMLLIGWLFGVPVRLARYETMSGAIENTTQMSKWRLKWFRLRKSWVFKLATTLLANSQSALDDLASVYQVDPEKIEVFYNYLVDPLNQYKLTVDHAPNSIECVGQFSKNKGQDVLVKALALLSPGFDVKVEFVGQGSFMQECQQLAQTLGVLNHCHFVGGIPHHEVFAHFAQAAVSVVPSLKEAFGYVCIESLAVGTPVLGSRVGGIPEIVRDQIDGLLFEPGDPQDLAEKIQLFFSSNNDQLIMRANARQRFLTTFEQKAVLNQQVEWLLSELAGINQ